MKTSDKSFDNWLNTLPLHASSSSVQGRGQPCPRVQVSINKNRGEQSGAARVRLTESRTKLPALQSSAFTLIELLVVIAIIAILAGLLLPTLGKAKAKGHSIACVNHLKQLQLAWTMYADDHNDMICPNHISMSSGEWRATRGSWVIGNAQIDTSPTNLESGVLFAYTKSLGVYHCPADRSLTTRGRKILRNRSYVLNTWLNIATDGQPWGPPNKTKMSQIVKPTGVFGFIDDGERSFGDAAFTVQPAPFGQWISIPSDRHAKGANLSYLDGHVDSHRWRHPKAKMAVYSPVQGKDDLQDLRWLQERLPRL